MARASRFAVFLVLVAGFAFGQETPQPTAEQADAVGQQAGTLEGELGKFKDNTPEAAEVMLKLVDLYHANGRVFGLVRVAQRFTASHLGHAQHKAVMLKLIDGLEGLSRNKDICVACRQFLAHYPEDPACPGIEIRLAEAQMQINDPLRTAEALHAVWKRQPTTEVGRKFGARAMNYYYAVGSTEAITRECDLGEEIVEKRPAGEFTHEVGWRTFNEWRRIGQWNKANRVGAKMLEKGISGEPETTRELHRMMGENFGNLGQHANCAEAYKKARAIRSDDHVLYQIVMRQHHAAAPLAEMEPFVAEYVTKYPERQERFHLQSYLAHAHFRVPNNANKPQGMAILASLLPVDAGTNSNAQTYLYNNGNEPAQLAQSEQLLLDAIQKNERDRAYLRYVLAIELYRDRAKTVEKARPVLRDLISQSPTDDGYTSAAVDWLLTNPVSEAEFQADVARIIKARRDFLHRGTFRNMLNSWAVQRKNAPDAAVKARSEFVQAELAKANADPVMALVLQSTWAWDEQQSGIRQKLIAPNLLDTMNKEFVHYLLGYEGYYLRHYSPGPRRPECQGMYGQLAKRFPQDYAVATTYLEVATDYGNPEHCKDALLNLVKLEPQYRSSDAWRRLMAAADRNNDPNLVKQAFDWIQKSTAKFGPDAGSASGIGDTLVKHKFEAEGVAYWTKYVTADRKHGESRECASRLLGRMKPEEKVPFIQELFKHDTDMHGRYAEWLATEFLAAKDYAKFDAVLRETRKRQNERPFKGWDLTWNQAPTWVSQMRGNMQATDAEKLLVYNAVLDLEWIVGSAAAQLAKLELTPEKDLSNMPRILAYRRATILAGDEHYEYDTLMPYVQTALAKKDFVAASTIATGMLASMANIGPDRQKSGREIITLSYARIGGVGLSIDDKSPIAPLMQAVLYLRLGDENMAFDAYLANKALFTQHRLEMPVDFVLFVCERLIAAGGDVNHDFVEETLRGWLVKHSESPNVDSTSKARVQLTLGRNYFKAQRYDVARNEFTTTLNRYANTPEAIEAEFGIGETFMAQKVFDQAETVFEKLAKSTVIDVVVRAEFLRGVLAFRRGDREEARDIFRGVLERVPNVELANQALFNLAEVYGQEERYLDQLSLLRTVGRLGRASKRRHAPGQPLSIVVHDSDLGVSRGHAKIPVRVTTEPGGDSEIVYLTGAGAGKGLFRVDLDTRLGAAVAGDKVLQLTGKDVIRCDYPETFKAEFKNVPLSDVEIKVASNGKFEISSSKIEDKKAETFSQQLAREASERDAPKSAVRPENQIKPGNLVYLRVQDADRDMSNDPDTITVKLTADSGDQVQLTLTETGSHTGVFEGTAQTAELPAGALATDSAIEHSPLMAIDRDSATFWMSQPDGVTPKDLTVDMKDLRKVSRVKFITPDAKKHAPVRGDILGSQDGEFFFRIASHPARPAVPPVAGEYGAMKRRVYAGNYTNYSTWNQVVALSTNGTPVEDSAVEELSWSRAADAEGAADPFGVLWNGKVVQPREGAVRIKVDGYLTAVVVNGEEELPMGKGGRHVDVWLDRGVHDLSIFAVAAKSSDGVSATWAKANLTTEKVELQPFRAVDFDLNQQAAKVAATKVERATVTALDDVWEIRSRPYDLRHVRLSVKEYLGEAVAISHVEVAGPAEGQVYIPTKNDVLTLSANNVLEIAAGDVVTATYSDEFTQNEAAGTQLLVNKLTATYNNASVTPINYDFVRDPNGAVFTVRKDLMRIEPGEKFVVEVTDYDEDRTNGIDSLRLQVSVNDGAPVLLTATETKEDTGIFTKEVFTSMKDEPGKLTVKQGDRIYVRYIDSQNTFPGHAVPRESVVYVNEPSEARIRVLETRLVPPPANSKAPPQTVYLPPSKQNGKTQAGVAFETPLTVEVIDPDQAKDGKSKIIVKLATTDGATADVECVISGAFRGGNLATSATTEKQALEEGRFIGQVIMQLGGKASPANVPLTASMPRGLIGRAKLGEGDDDPKQTSLVTHVLNLTGKDVITATYEDKLRPATAPQVAGVTAKARLISNGVLAVTDREYEKPVSHLHVGEKLFLLVTDPDQDSSDNRDVVTVEITSELGERETVELSETLAHSGVFTGSFLLKAVDKPMPNNLLPDNPVIETYFGDNLRVVYVDKVAANEKGELELKKDLPVVVGTDGLVAAFTKTFNNEGLAVETKFRIAESYFELFKSHKSLGRKDEEKTDLEAGKRILREVMEDYPDPKYAPRIAYLLGQFAQELGQWDEAIRSYETILRQFPEHTLAADAQYKLAQSHEEAGNFDEALEQYVTLAATYPKSPLIPSVMIRISDYFYKHENFRVAAQVGEKFLDKFTGHEHATRIAFRVGQCYYKSKDYKTAASSFDKFVKKFPDDSLTPDAMFWAGESYRLGNDVRHAFIRYNRCRQDFPASEAAKYARGRLALPEMLAQFEAEINSLDNE